KHVRPATQPAVGVFPRVAFLGGGQIARSTTERPAGADHPSGVCGGVSVEPDRLGGEPGGGEPGGLGRVGGVFGQVGRDGGGGEFAALVEVIGGQADDTGVDLGAPLDRPACPVLRVCGGSEAGRLGGGGQQLREGSRGNPYGWG